jgi:hypothetical protein
MRRYRDNINKENPGEPEALASSEKPGGVMGLMKAFRSNMGDLGIVNDGLIPESIPAAESQTVEEEYNQYVAGRLSADGTDLVDFWSVSHPLPFTQ